MNATHAPPARCPSCTTVLAADLPPRCPACGAGVGGDVGRRIIAIDRRLANLTAERDTLLVRLRREATLSGPVTAPTRLDDATAPPAMARATAVPAAGAAEPALHALSAPRDRMVVGARRWLGDAGPQTLLAVTGVLLLATAAVVFTAVAWRDLPMAARGGILLGAAAGTGRMTSGLARRGLRRTAEATSVLTVILLAVLANGLWRAGLLDGFAGPVGVLAVSTLALAGTAHALARRTTTRAPLVLGAWLLGIGTCAAGMWLTDGLTGRPGGARQVLAVLATALAAAAAAGGYAARVLPVLPRWRLATLVAAGLGWTAAAVTTPVVLATISPTGEPVPYAVGVGVSTAAVVVAALARGIRGRFASRWPAVGTAGMWAAGTLGCAGALSRTVAAWSDLQLVVALGMGTALLLRYRPTWRRRSAALGMIPVAVLTLAPVARTLSWLAAVTAGVASAGTPPAPDPARLASLAVLAMIGLTLAAGVDGARAVASVAAVVTWTVAAVGAAAGMAVLTPSRPDDLGPYVACAIVAVLLAATAAIAGRRGAVGRAGAAAGVAFAATAGVAGALTGRLAIWPELPLVVSAAVGVALLRSSGSGARRRGTLAGIVPVVLLAAVPVARTVEWVTEGLALRVLVPWSGAPSWAGALPVATLASAVALVALGGGIAVLLGRGRAPAAGAVAVSGALVLTAVGAATSAIGGAAAVGLLLVAAAVHTLRRGSVEVVAALGLVGASAVTAAAALTTPAVTIATFAAAATTTAVAVPLRPRAAAWAAAGVCTADLLALVAAVAAATTEGPGPVGLALVGGAACAWLTAAAARAHRHQAAAVEAVGAVAFGVGLGLAAVRGPAWLGSALAVLAVTAAAIAVRRPDRRGMRWLAAAAAAGASWAFLADAGVGTVEAYTAPPALLIIALAVPDLRSRPDRSSWPVLGTGLTLLTSPTVAQLIGDPTDLARLAAALGVGAVLVVVGRRQALQSPLVVGVAVLSLAAVTQYPVVTAVVPRWALLAAAGTLLLVLSAGYERQRSRLVAARRRLLTMR